MPDSILPLVRSNIRNLVPYSSARSEFTGSDAVLLDANENPFGKLNRYPDPYQAALKQKIAALKKMDSNQLFLGNGSDEIIDLAFRIFCEPNKDKALCFYPSYGMYRVSAHINSVDMIELPLNSSFQIDIAALQPYIDDAAVKLIFICSPNNPTGNLIQQSDLTYILERFKGIVVLDEAYIDFCPQASFTAQLSRYPRLIILQTLSKAWGLAAVRIGMGWMCPAMLSLFNKVKAPYNISLLNQEAALQALNNSTAYEQQVASIIAQRNLLIQELRLLKRIKKIYPSQSNFILIEVPHAHQWYQQLVKEKIIVRNRHAEIENCLRITVGNREENLQLLNALKKLNNG